jgi:prepilin-type N-terminal cleavage/methylation domain-containing protein
MDRYRGGFSVIELLVVLALFGIIAAIAVPASQPAVSGYRLAGDAHAISYQISLAKMRAAASFTRARLFVNPSDSTYRQEAWDKVTNTWATAGGTERLAQGVGFGYSAITTAPPNTQGTIGQAAACRDDSGAAIDGTSCVVFNSRGVPIDTTGAPTGTDAIYVTDGTAVYTATVSATGMTQLWWTPARALAWQRQ